MQNIYGRFSRGGGGKKIEGRPNMGSEVCGGV